MGDEPLHVPDGVTCAKCKYKYKSSVTVFAAKDVTYESKCPQCSHVNKKKLKKETILASTKGSEGKAPAPSSKRDTRVSGIIKGADIKGLYLTVGAVCAYMLGWIFQWIAGDGYPFVHDTGSFLEKLAIPVFGLGIALLLFAIATRNFPK